MGEKTLIVVCGPTAIGKTSLSIKLARHYNTEILSADSRQFYREMAIGTAKPNDEELAAIRHHFVNSHSVTEDFSVGDYEREAVALIGQLFEATEKLVMVGGSGLFISAVCQGFDHLPPVSANIRAKLNKDYEKFGLAHLQEKLRKVDPLYFAEVDIYNPQRLIRALEVYEASGRAFSSYRIRSPKTRNFRTVKIGLNIDRKQLYNAINKRVDLMMESGLLDEVRQLIQYKNRPALKTVGYSELFSYLEGTLSLEKAIDLIKQNTRRYAKRQLTWFKKDPEIVWFEPGKVEEVISYIDSYNAAPAPSQA